MNSKNARFVVTSAIKEFAKERRGIVFTVDIQHAEDLRDDIVKEGFSAAVVHSKVSLEERRQILTDFAAGKIQFVTNPMILTEGFDCPVADCMINAAPTMNRSLYIQKAGRVLRLSPDKKDALLIDFGKSTKKNELCTAATLMGKYGYVEVDSVTEEDQLFSETEDKNKALELEIIVDASIYDPLSGGFAFKNSTEEKLFTPKYWITSDEIITEKQRSFLKTLGKATKIPLPKKKTLDQMSMEQASRCIKYLKAKKEHLDNTTPLTEKQRAYINYNIGWDTLQKLGVSSIKGLTKKKAQMVIGSFKKMETHHQNSYVY